MSANLSFVDLAEGPHVISESGVPANLRVADNPPKAPVAFQCTRFLHNALHG